MFRIFRRRDRQGGPLAAPAHSVGAAMDLKYEQVRHNVELRLLEELQRSGVQIAAAEDADHAKFDFKEPGAAVSAACRAAAITVDQLVVTQRRLDVARNANLRLAERLRSLERQCMRDCEANAAVERQERANQAERQRLQARNDTLAASLRTMVDVADGYKEAELRHEEDMQLEREAHALHIEALQMQLADIARSKANVRARASAIKAQRDAALQELGLPSREVSREDQRSVGPPPSSKPGITSSGSEDEFSLRPPPVVYSLSATQLNVSGPSAAEPADVVALAGKQPNKPSKNLADPQTVQYLQRQVTRLRKELHVEAVKRSELEATLMNTQSSLRKAETLIATLQTALRSQEGKAAGQRDQAVEQAKLQLKSRLTDPPMSIAAGGTHQAGSTAAGAAPRTPTRVRASEPDPLHVVRTGEGKSGKLVLRSPERRGSSGQSALPSGGADSSAKSSATVEGLPAVHGAAVDHNAAAKKATSEGSTEFNVRGPKYLTDKMKIPAGRPVAKLIHVDFYQSQGRQDHIMRWKPSFPEQKDHYLFVVNIQVPGQPFVNCTMFYALPLRALPEDLRGEVQAGVDDRSEALLLQEMGLADPTVEEGSAASSEENLEEFKILLGEFVNGSDSYRDGRFKLIPALVDAPWVVRRAVGNRPAIVGRKLKNRYFRGDGYIEVDIDISSSSVATSVLALVRDYAKSLIVEIGFLMEAQKAAELPEKLLGTIRFSHVDFAEVCQDISPPQGAEEALVED